MRPVRLSGAAFEARGVDHGEREIAEARTASRRSRVTPGAIVDQHARRLPTRRLNSVDLPTFGRPTMADP
jgi:hypothetical protein